MLKLNDPPKPHRPAKARLLIKLQKIAVCSKKSPLMQTRLNTVIKLMKIY